MASIHIIELAVIECSTASLSEYRYDSVWVQGPVRTPPLRLDDRSRSICIHCFRYRHIFRAFESSSSESTHFGSTVHALLSASVLAVARRSVALHSAWGGRSCQAWLVVPSVQTMLYSLFVEKVWAQPYVRLAFMERPLSTLRRAHE
jgi:hypothetical protein